MSTTLIPEADPERLLEIEKTGETDKLKALANRALEEAEITREYDIGYTTDSQKKGDQAGTHYRPREVSPYYDGSEPDIHVPIESNVEVFYANLDGEFRLIDDDREDRTYKLVMSCDDGMLLKGEIGFGEREVTNFRYKKGQENPNRLQVYLDGNWCQFGEADEIGEGNETMKHIELIESIYKQLNETRSEDSSWEIFYSSNMERDLENLPDQVESTLENKTNNFEQNLELGLSPSNIFKAMSPPWKPLLEMNLGRNYRAIFIESSHIPENKLPEDVEEQRNLVGLCARPKTELNDEFGTKTGRNDSDALRTNGLNYALNLL